MTAAVIQAEYADYKRVKGRRVLQIICEVPIEHAPKVHELFGEPEFGEKQINVAIAKMDMAAVAQESVQQEESKKKNYPAQAAMLCENEAFQRFLARDMHSMERMHKEQAANEVRVFCCVNSRSEIVEGTPAAARWQGLYRDFQYWLNT